MLKPISRFLLAVLLVFAVTACSSELKGQDPAKVKVDLVTEPSPVKTGEKAVVTAKISGLTTQEGARVQLDVRLADNSGLPELLDAKSSGDGNYSIEKTFDQPGKYAIYVHLYQGVLHITKKKVLDVS
ncbi:FixH family protein [Paenibacillus chitinolyticus]|uniref:FixH family protein n=1 Tax=Paenibacillus chitinolyticus TaxID=79263 RepID=UPI003D06C954